jgi:hypothetical protein
MPRAVIAWSFAGGSASDLRQFFALVRSFGNEYSVDENVFQVRASLDREGGEDRLRSRNPGRGTSSLFPVFQIPSTFKTTDTGQADATFPTPPSPVQAELPTESHLGSITSTLA